MDQQAPTTHDKPAHDKPARYTGTAIFLHWAIAALILGNIALALLWERFPDAAVRPAIDTHKSIGITVLGLVLMRILWRITHKPPPLPDRYPRWETALSTLVHAALYILMLAIPLAGWIMDSAWERAAENPMPFFYLFEWPRIAPIMALDPATKKQIHDLFGELHELSAFALLALVVLHVAGALKHQFIDREREIQRMWRR